MYIFKVHNVSQWSNLRHLAEPLRGAVGLLEAVSFKEVMECVCRGRTTGNILDNKTIYFIK